MAEPPRWRVGLVYGTTDTDVKLSNDLELRLEQRMVAASLRHSFGGGWYVGGAAGVITGGSLTRGATEYRVEPGGMFALEGGREWLGENSANLFLTTTATLAVAATPTVKRPSDSGGARETATLVATDVRVDVSFGITLWRTLSPYVAARAFGGPFFWTVDGESLTGSDPAHHSIAVGAALTFDSLDLGVDWAFQGARGLAVSIGSRF